VAISLPLILFRRLSIFSLALARRERVRVRVSFPCHREHGVFCHAWRSLFGFSSAKKLGIATDGLRRKIKKIENLKRQKLTEGEKASLSGTTRLAMTALAPSPLSVSIIPLSLIPECL